MTRNLAVALPLSRIRELGLLGGYGLHVMEDKCNKGLFILRQDPEFVMPAYWDVNLPVP